MKYTLRKQFISIRNSKDLYELNISSDHIVMECIQKIDWSSISSVSIYYPINKEVDILRIVEFLKSRNITISLPVEKGFALWNDAVPLETNKWGAKEPLIKQLVIPDLAIVPMVCFDRRGYRIGYGSGFYDKTLCKMDKVLKIGIAYSFQETSYIPNENHDIRLDSIITEKEFILCA